MNQSLEEYLKKMENEHLSEDIGNHLEILNSMTTVLADLVDSLAVAKVKLEPTQNWMYHSQTLVIKIIFHVHSMISLSDGFKITPKYILAREINVRDSASILILCRAVIESYITLCYLYNNEHSLEEKIFRYKLWELSGLISRQNLTGSTPELVEKKIQEKEVIDRILREIKNMPEYSSLDKKRLNQLRGYGLPRIDSWQSLIKQSNLKDEILSGMYSLASNYAHSEYLAILQLSQSNTNKDNLKNNSFIISSLNIAKIIVAMSIDYYTTTHPIANQTYTELQGKVKTSIQLWRSIGHKK